MSFSILKCSAAISKSSIFAPRAIQTASFATKKISNYANDLILLKGFHDAASANADGKIHVDNALDLFAKLKAMSVPGNEYPQGRKHIVAYAREEYEWADGADKAFKKGLQAWTTERRALTLEVKKSKEQPKN